MKPPSDRPGPWYPLGSASPRDGDDDVIVLDGFYADPMRVRQFAIQSSYRAFEQVQNFPGIESERAFFSESHIRRFERLVGHNIVVDPGRWVFGKFRCARERDDAQTAVHLDCGVDWTAVVYLSLEEHCRGGLGIYRHRALDLVRAPSPEELPRFVCSDLAEFDRRYVTPVTLDSSAWELFSLVPMRLNRLVLFRGARRFHSIVDRFGTSIENARLTQNFFFNVGGTG